MFRKSPHVVGACVALALAVSACGSTEKDKDLGDVSGSNLTKAPLVVGMLAPLTGQSVFNTVESVGKAWASWINSNGGINGHPVKMIVKDTKNDPAVALAISKELVEQDGVDVIVSNDGATEYNSGPYLSAENIAVVGAIGYADSLWGTKSNYFGTALNNHAVAQGTGQLAEAVGAKKMAYGVCAEVAVCAELAPLREEAAAAHGVGWGGVIKVEGSAPNYTAQCLQLRDEDVDFVELGLTATNSARFMRDCAAQGFKPTYSVSAGSLIASAFDSVKDVKIVGVLSGFPWWVDDAPVKEFRDVMDTYASEIDYRDAASTVTWASLELIRAALADLPDEVTPKTVLQTVKAVKDENLGGLLAEKVNFVDEDTHPLLSCWRTYENDGGKYKLLSGDLTDADCLTSS